MNAALTSSALYFNLDKRHQIKSMFEQFLRNNVSNPKETFDSWNAYVPLSCVHIITKHLLDNVSIAASLFVWPFNLWLKSPTMHRMQFTIRYHYTHWQVHSHEHNHTTALWQKRFGKLNSIDIHTHTHAQTRFNGKPNLGKMSNQFVKLRTIFKSFS